MVRVSEENKVFGISVIIPNWNGIEFLPRCLTQLFEALKNFNGKAEVIVVDNDSTDQSIDYINKYYPDVKIIQFETNKGFAAACNEGARKAKHNLLFFLNNDVFVEKDFLTPLVEHFRIDRDAKLFAVSCRLLYDGTNELQLGRTAAKMPFGLFGVEFLSDNHAKSSFTLYPSGGASLVNREKFLQLGGFDPHLYYFEDVDLGYRAWKRGWIVLYEPKSTVYHVCRGTSSRTLNRFAVDSIIAKGRFVFTWKSITNRRLRLAHFLGIPLVLFGSILTGKKYLFSGFLQAVNEWDYAKQKRSFEIKGSKNDDLNVFLAVGKKELS